MNLVINCTAPGVKKYPLHTHNFFEIMFYMEGQGHLHTEKEDYPFSPGTAIIVPPGIPHGSVSDSGFKNISIGGDFAHLIFAEKPFSLSDNKNCDGEFLAKLIYRNRYSDPHYLSDLATAYVRFLLMEANLKNPIQTAVHKIYLNILDKAFDKNIDIGEILRASGYTEDYIRMCFTKRFGVPPLKFLTKIRMEHACSLLDIYKDSISLSEIAEKCGFDDYVYFSKTFKAHTNKSPSQYRLE